MAEFCKDCSIALFGADYRDFANILNSKQYDNENGALVICECCGPIVVDKDGKRMSVDFFKECSCELMNMENRK